MSAAEDALRRALALPARRQIKAMEAMCGPGPQQPPVVTPPDPGVDLPVEIAHWQAQTRSVFPRTPKGEADRTAWRAAVAVATDRGGVRTVHCPAALSTWTGPDLEAFIAQMVDALPEPVPVLDTPIVRQPRNQWFVVFAREGRRRGGDYWSQNMIHISTGQSGWRAYVTLPEALPLRAILEWSTTFGAVCNCSLTFGPALRRALERPASLAEDRETLSRAIRILQDQLEELGDTPTG